MDRLHRADVASALDAPDVQPWHMKMAVQLFSPNVNGKEKSPEQGMVEEWWAAPHSWRIVYAMPSYKATELQTEAGLFRTKGAELPPVMLDLLRDQVVHPMPLPRDVESALPELRKEKFGKAPLECIMLDQPIKQKAVLPLGLFPTYCFDPGKDSLRVSYDFGSQLVLRNEVSDFQGRAVAREIAIHLSEVPAASARVFKLETMEADAAGFAVSDDLESVGAAAVRVGAVTMNGRLVSQVKPAFPEAAKRRGATGVVTMHAVIGRDGHIHSLQLVSTPDPDLAVAAMAAVRQWTYSPYLLHGEPTEVQTTIVINFALH